MILTRKLYVDPDSKTASTLWFVSRCATRTWNALIEHRNKALKAQNPCGYATQKKLVPAMKKADERLRYPASQVIQEVVKELHGALKSWQTKRANGDTQCQPPAFRRSGDFFPQHYPQRTNSFSIEQRTLKLAFGRNPKDWLTLTLPAGDYARVKTVRLGYDRVQQRFFVCLHEEIQEAEKVERGDTLYFDPGCKTALTGITLSGDIFEYDIQPLRELNLSTYRLIDQLMSQRDHKTRKSYAWCRLNRRIVRLWRKVKDRTRSYLHTLANQIFASHPGLKTIRVGDWKKQETLADTGHAFVNKRINRAVQNNNPVRMLFDFLRYKGTLRHGVCVEEFDERNTTRTCSQCLHVHDKGIAPGSRTFECEYCGFAYPRDWQAGLNFIRLYEPAAWTGLSGHLPDRSVRTTLAPFSLKAQKTQHIARFSQVIV